MSELDKIRENINSIDEQMAQLFQERMEMSRQVAAFKKDRGLSIRDAERERELIDRDRRFIKDPAVDGYYVQFLRSILDLSCAYQSRLLNGMKVAYSGVEGAYGYIAARRMFPEAQLIAYPDFTAAHKAVEQGEADSAVLPLENSYAGEVGAVMDLLFSGELYINQVMDLEIDHSLLGVEGAAVDTVKTVVSHPQALRQCDDYIKRHGYATETYSNTALAAAHVRDVNDPALAAIASEEAAEVFGLRVLERGINTVDPYDVHGVWDTLQEMDAHARKGNASAIISAGWDPGSDSIIRALMLACVPRGITHTNFGPGMSMGHTVAAKAIPGVANALSMTIPLGEGLHRRMVYVELAEGTDFKTVEAAIKADPYFAHDETHVFQVDDVKQLIDRGHSVLLTRKGVSGITDNQNISFSMNINNPALTSQIMVSCARAATRQAPGARTMLEIPVIDMLPGERKDLIQQLV